MTATLRQLAALVHGTLDGDGDVVVHSARTLQDAQPGDITFLDKINAAALLEESKATTAVAPLDLPTIRRPRTKPADGLEGSDVTPSL